MTPYRPLTAESPEQREIRLLRADNALLREVLRTTMEDRERARRRMVLHEAHRRQSVAWFACFTLAAVTASLLAMAVLQW